MVRISSRQHETIDTFSMSGQHLYCKKVRLLWITALLIACYIPCVAQAPDWPQPLSVPQNPPPVGGEIPPQEENRPPERSVGNERWNLFWQATSVGQYHGVFPSPYEDAYSLQNHVEHDVSLTTTLFFGLRLDQNSYLYFNPEVAGGRGFSGVNGLANSSNGELPRVSSATPKPYLARLYLMHDVGFGSTKESFESEENQLAGGRPVVRYTIIAGRFTLTDFFDNNRYSHDPRTQFLGWAVMYNGAWDYSADVRGYTWGLVQELHTTNWSFRYGVGLMPTVANGSRLDHRIEANRGQVFEGEYRYLMRKHPGALRMMPYLNYADAGTYQESIHLAQQNGGVPDITATRKSGTPKYGIGMNTEQELTRNIGFFTRLGWNDGKTESFAFTAVDRLAQGGASVTGGSWKRPFDTAASEFTAVGLSGVHAQYLALGGHDFLIGDGRLQYGAECVWESYYSARVVPGFFTTIDFQHVNNPAYNQARGPLWIYSLRLHIELGKENFSHHSQ